MGKFLFITSIFVTLISSFSLAKTLDEKIHQRIQNMTLEEKVGQLFIVGFPQTSLTKDLDSFLKENKPGAFLLFKRNIQSAEQIKNFNKELYRASFRHTKLPPLIAIDQEGGSVSRLPIEPAPPNALALGQTQSPLLADEMGYQMGLFLREVGFNMNLAPVLDIADPSASSFIGVRSFGSDPKIVAELGTAYSKGLLRSKVIPTAKHFPGTGSLTTDPHHSVAKNNATLAELKTRDLKPYESYVSSGDNVAIMLSHLSYPALDPSGEPATFSRKISKDILRGEYHFRGLVITDDLQMQGSRQLLRPEVGALKALQAGADIVMLTWSFADQRKAFDYVKNAVESGALPIDDLHEKLHRILKTKAFANLYRRDPKLSPLMRGYKLTSKDYSDLESNILDKNLQTNLLPQRLPEKVKSSSRKPASQIERVCILSPNQTFIRSFRKYSDKQVEAQIVSKSFSTAMAVDWMREKKCSVTIGAVTGTKTANVFQNLPRKEQKELIVVNLGAPRLVPKNKEFLRVIQLYFNHSESGKKIAQHLDEILQKPSRNYVGL